MSVVDNFKNFVKKIYEIKIDYLKPSKQKQIKSGDVSQVRRVLGKIFKDAPTTSGKSYGLQFQKIADSIDVKYKIIFPKDFFKYFFVNNYDSLYGGENPDYPLTISSEKTRRLRKLTTQSSDYIYTDWIQDLTVEDILTDSIVIEHEKKLNRIHFPEGIPMELRGIGLGYIIYEEFIKFLGYASSSEEQSSDFAKKIWSQIINDKDFLPVVFKTQRPSEFTFDDGKVMYRTIETVMVFHRDFKGNIPDVIKQSVEVINERLNRAKSRSPRHDYKIVEIEIDGELLSKYPVLKDYSKIF